MSVLCSRIPNFALRLAARHQPELPSQPVALLGPDGEVCGFSLAAHQHGVRLAMNPRQAQMRCPGLLLLPVDLPECQAAQDAFLAELAQWELPVEAHGLGMAYIDLHTITTERPDAQGLAADLGRRLRRALGDDLLPALGWDHSKFCARAAAYNTQAGRMKLVAKADEVTFLAPLPISLLPLPSLDLQRLHWLGIQTLGQFAALSAAAVWQQFGKPGQLAHRWAQGRDNRPVQNMLHATWSSLIVDFDTPITQIAPVVDGIMARLDLHIEAWSTNLQGCTRLRLELQFVNHEQRFLDLVWVEPVCQPARLRLHLSNQLAALNWPAALDRVSITQAVTAELPAVQMTLFVEAGEEVTTPSEVAQSLVSRYGAIFLRGLVTDDSHPVDERRFDLVAV